MVILMDVFCMFHYKTYDNVTLTNRLSVIRWVARIENLISALESHNTQAY